MTGFILFINFVLWSIVNVISLSSSISSFPSSTTTTTFSNSLGINIHNLKLNNSVVSLIKNSFGFVRTDLTWEKIERVKGIYNFTEYDLFIEHLAPVKLYFTIDYSNKLYLPKGKAPYTEETIKYFAKFVLNSITHFKNRGFIFEIYNEPNWVFWKPYNPWRNGTAYINLVKGIINELTSVTDGNNKLIITQEDLLEETIIGPALAAPPLGGLGIDDKFLNDLLKNESILCFFDYISLHLYTQYEPESRIDIYRQVTDSIKENWRNDNMCATLKKHNNNNNDKKEIPKLISGEWGWSTCKTSKNKPIPCLYKGILEAVTGANTDIDQAKFISRMYLMNTMSQVDFSVYYDLIDDGEHYGIINVMDDDDGGGGIQPKLAYKAVNTLYNILGNSTYKERISSKIINDNHNNVCNAFSKIKKDCGYYGITKNECEKKKGCCFDEPYIVGPQCYYSNGGNETIFVLKFVTQNKNQILAAWRNGTGKNKIEEEYVLVEVEYLMEGNSSSCYQVYDYLGKKITQVCNEKESNLLYLNISDRPRFFVV